MFLLIMAIVGGLMLVLLVIYAVLSSFLGPLVDWMPGAVFNFFREKTKDDGSEKD
jgi:hypothetical protein